MNRLQVCFAATIRLKELTRLSAVFLEGLPGEAPDLRRDRHLPCQLETHRAGSHPAGVQGLGRPGGVER